jgi:hypothetical protein
MNCCICGPVKNCASYLNKVLENIEQLGSLFDDYTIVIYYDKSNDNTLEILKQYQNKNPKLKLYINANPLSKFRTHNIAIARNFCLNFVRNNKEQFNYFIMMDFDDVNCKNINVNTLGKYLKREDWDGLSFNTSPSYYDIWGLSIWPYCFSYNHFNDNYNYHGIIKEYVMRKLNSLKPGHLLPCISSLAELDWIYFQRNTYNHMQRHKSLEALFTEIMVILKADLKIVNIEHFIKWPEKTREQK